MLGFKSRTKRERREAKAAGADKNPWDKPLPTGTGKPTAVIARLQETIAKLEAQRHGIHADDARIRDAAAEHHDKSARHIDLLGKDLAAEPDDDIMAQAHAQHLAERRGAEEVHRDVSGRMGTFRPKL